MAFPPRIASPASAAHRGGAAPHAHAVLNQREGEHLGNARDYNARANDTLLNRIAGGSLTFEQNVPHT